MNYTPLDDAYKIHHIKSNTYVGNILFSPSCIFCNSSTSKPLMKNDGGSFRQCDRCKKHFKARVVNEAINNFSYSTYHLRGTN
jgi:hypothetical protein